jgi:hypothetical protein
MGSKVELENVVAAPVKGGHVLQIGIEAASMAMAECNRPPRWLNSRHKPSP